MPGEQLSLVLSTWALADTAYLLLYARGREGVYHRFRELVIKKLWDSSIN